MGGFEVARGIWQFRLPLGRGGPREANIYLLPDMETIVDAGGDSREARSTLMRELKSLGVGASDLKRIIITHLHRDHIGLVGFIRSTSRVEVYAHEAALEISGSLDKGGGGSDRFFDTLGGGRLYRMVEAMMRGPMGLRPAIEVDHGLRDGESIFLEGSTLKVYWTPGHAREHICLLDVERRILFSGDHILPSITPHVGLRGLDGSDPLGDYLLSLRRVRGLDVRMALPGHGDPIRDVRGRIDEIIRHHERRLVEVENALRDGERTAFEVAERIQWRSVPWGLMPPWVKRMAAEEALAHLMHLKNLGVLDYRIKGGIPYFYLR